MLKILTLLCLLLCNVSIFAQSQDTQKKASVLEFTEYRQGVGEWPLTYTITEDFMRIDDVIDNNSESAPGFVLLDRKQQAIYSVNPEEQQIIKVRSVPVNINSPITLKPLLKELPQETDAPKIAGHSARHYQYFINDKLCFDAVSIPGFLTSDIEALAEFKRILAGQQSQVLSQLPEDVHEACDLARHTFYPTWILEQGLPVIEQVFEQQSENKTLVETRTLTNFKQLRVGEQFFELPDYPVMTVN